MTIAPATGPASTSAIHRLAASGQSVWLDDIRRDWLHDGGLARRIAEHAVTGLTSNPALFEKAIAATTLYDAALAALPAGHAPEQAFEALATEDLARACDLLAHIHAETHGNDGWASLEVSPALADNADGTVLAARRLRAGVGRDNLMIKVPGTPAGARAIETLTAEGFSINVTLLFSRSAWATVAESYLAGLEERLARGESIRGQAGVASFFVSRIDTAIDADLDRRGITPEAGPRGQAALANAQVVYAEWEGLFGLESPRWQSLAAAGAHPQRLLWASTGVKNPAYPDTLYVENLIGPETVNTMPPATLEAFADHGHVPSPAPLKNPSVLAAARETLQKLPKAGVDIAAVGDALLVDGLKQFADAFARLLAAVEAKQGMALKAKLGQAA